MKIAWGLDIDRPVGNACGFTSELVVDSIDRWGSPDDEEFLRFNLRKVARGEGF